MIAACLYLARGEDELRVAGALLGEPVELVRCTAVPLEVPAGCEIVLEGELDLDADGRGRPGLGVPRRLRALRPRRDGHVPAASRAGATRSTRRSCRASTPSTR